MALYRSRLFRPPKARLVLHANADALVVATLGTTLATHKVDGTAAQFGTAKFLFAEEIKGIL